jgi:hypothetical protein
MVCAKPAPSGIGTALARSADRHTSRLAQGLGARGLTFPVAGAVFEHPARVGDASAIGAANGPVTRSAHHSFSAGKLRPQSWRVPRSSA